MDHNVKADQHFKAAEAHIKDGRHDDAWKELSNAQVAASKHAHGMAEGGNLDAAKAYRKMVTGRVAHLSRVMNKAEAEVRDVLEKAKEMVAKNDVKGALELLKGVKNRINGHITECPECGSDAALLKEEDSESGECGECGAAWGKKNPHHSLVKYVKEGDMSDPDKKEQVLKKSDIVSALWELYRRGEPGVDAYDINYFDCTGWLKKSLAQKLGLPLPGEEDGELQKEEEPKVKLEKGGMEPDSFLSKSQILNALLEMMQNGVERSRINRKSVTKFESTGEIDDDVMGLVYKHCGKDWFDLKKKMQKTGPSMLAQSEEVEKEDAEQKKEYKKLQSKAKKLPKLPKMEKEKGDSDFLDDKKEHDHQLRGAKKPILKKKKSLAKEKDWPGKDLDMERYGKKPGWRDEKPAEPRKAKFSNRAAPSKIGIKVKQHGSKYHGGGDPGVSDGGDD